MIIEDEALIGMDLEEVVRSAGYEPFWVGSLQTALRSIEASPPAFAIIDIKLHDGDGTDLIHELEWRHIPFIIHSGSFDDKSLQLQGIPWLSKPAEPSAILNAMARVLNRPVQTKGFSGSSSDDPA